MSGAWISLKSGRVYYRFSSEIPHAGGEGPPILLLHSVGTSGEAWDRVRPALARRFTVYAPDFPSHGRSDKPPRDWSLEQYALALLEFMDALGLEQAHLVGNSIGAVFAVAMAARAAERVSKVVLVGCPGWETAQEKQERRALARAFLDENNHPKPYTLEDLAQTYQRPTPRLLEWVNRTRAQAGVWVWKALESLFAYDIAPRLRAVRASTLVIYGEKDQLRDKEPVLLRGIRNSRSVTISRAGHLPQLDAPTAFVATVLPFLEG